MTIIVACKFWKAVGVIADCRVSYLPKYSEVDDYLQKLYQIDNRLVMGFAGPLQGAYEVMKLVRKNLQSYPKPRIADNFRRDVQRWIQYRYRELDEPDRRDLSFIVSTVEPTREMKTRWLSSDERGKIHPSSKPSWFPFIPEWKINVFIPSQSDPTKLVSQESRFIRVIGVKKEDRLAIEGTITRHYGFSFKRPDLQMQVILDFLMNQVKERQIRTVGGLLQGALLNERGIQWIGYAGSEVILEFGENRFVQRNTRTGQTQPLLSIWEWAKNKPPPGSFGAFEDLNIF